MAHRNRHRLTRQVECLQRHFAQGSGLPLADVLDRDDVLHALREHQVSFRERVFSPLVTLWVFLSQILDPDHSCRQAVARLLAYRKARQLPSCSPNTGAYCQARARLPEGVLASLTRRTGWRPLEEAPGRWLWKGRDVKIVDGTTVSMPDTPANQAAFPQAPSQKQGVGFPLARMVVVFSLAVGTVLDAILGPYQGKETGETALFRQLHERLAEGDVLLADRYYCSYFELAWAVGRGVDVVMRLHQRRVADFRRGRRLGSGDHVVTWSKPPKPAWLDAATYANLPDTLVVRAVYVRVRQAGFRTQALVVVTTLVDPAETSADEIAILYRWRWQAELDLRSLKSVLQMDVLRCQSPELVRKEVWAHLLVYNVIRGVMTQAAAAHGLLPRELSFKGALQTVNAFAPYLLTARPCDWADLRAELLRAVASHAVGDRPNRSEPRATKRRPKSYALLNEPRAHARARLAQGSCG